MIQVPKFKAEYQSKLYDVTAMHLLDNPYVLLGGEITKDGIEDIEVPFKDIDEFYNMNNPIEQHKVISWYNNDGTIKEDLFKGMRTRVRKELRR